MTLDTKELINAQFHQPYEIDSISLIKQELVDHMKLNLLEIMWKNKWWCRWFSQIHWSQIHIVTMASTTRTNKLANWKIQYLLIWMYNFSLWQLIVYITYSSWYCIINDHVFTPKSFWLPMELLSSKTSSTKHRQIFRWANNLLHAVLLQEGFF